jgi:hypothetical protein
MQLDPGMHIGLHLVLFGKSGLTPCEATPVATSSIKAHVIVLHPVQNQGCLRIPIGLAKPFLFSPSIQKLL